MGLIIAIDGPAASGKGVVAARLASVMHGHHLDTGVLYRILAHHILQKNINNDDVPKITALIDQIDFNLNHEFIRTHEVGNTASQIAVHPEVRTKLNVIQREFTNNKEVSIIEGRDIGTVIFPHADCKLYITASLDTRARRRYNQLSQNISFEQVRENMILRDNRDSNRDNAPMKIANDATVIRTDNLSIDEVIKLVSEVVVRCVSVQNGYKS